MEASEVIIVYVAFEAIESFKSLFDTYFSNLVMNPIYFYRLKRKKGWKLNGQT